MTKTKQMQNFRKEIKKTFQKRRLVLGKGSVHSPIMVIGEAPNVEDIKKGSLLNGKSGKLLYALLTKNGLDRRKMYLTTVLKWRPVHGRKAKKKEMKIARNYLSEEIDIINPQYILAVGNIALNSLGIRRPVMSTHGRILLWGKKKIRVMPTFHPSHAVRDPHIEKIMIDNIKSLKKFIKENSALDKEK